jgi:hypothetical protein
VKITVKLSPGATGSSSGAYPQETKPGGGQCLEDYEKKFQARKLNTLQKTAKAMGFELLAQPISPAVS